MGKRSVDFVELHNLLEIVNGVDMGFEMEKKSW